MFNYVIFVSLVAIPLLSSYSDYPYFHTQQEVPIYSAIMDVTGSNSWSDILY